MKRKLFLLTVLWHSLLKEVTCDGGGSKTKSWRKDFIPFNSMTFEGNKNKNMGYIFLNN